MTCTGVQSSVDFPVLVLYNLLAVWGSLGADLARVPRDGVEVKFAAGFNGQSCIFSLHSLPLMCSRLPFFRLVFCCLEVK